MRRLWPVAADEFVEESTLVDPEPSNEAGPEQPEQPQGPEPAPLAVKPCGVVTVDDRAGSRELAPLLERLELDVEVKRLPFADMAFEGWGPKGRCRVGIERKTVRDMLNSLESGRFPDHQLTGMLEDYDFSFLVVEGNYRRDPVTGLLQTPVHGGWWTVKAGPQRTYPYTRLEHGLLTLELHTPLKVRRVGGIRETASFVWSLAHYYQKQWREHSTLKVFYDNAPPETYVWRVGLVRRVAKEFPLIGWERSAVVAARFKSVRDMVNASAAEWMEIPGVGDGIAGKVCAAIDGIRLD